MIDDEKCPNSKDLFSNYLISSNETNWDPDTRTIFQQGWLSQKIILMVKIGCNGIQTWQQI